MKLFELFATLDLDTSSFDKSVTSTTAKANAFGKSMLSTAQRIDASFTKWLKRGAVAVAGVGTLLAKTGLEYNMQMENYTTNFKVMLGSQEAAVKKVEELRKFAAATPFGMEDLADATQTLLAFQIPAKESTDILKMLGDVALGNKEKLAGLATVFGQVSSAGKLQGQDLMQLINQGFNPLNYIAQRTGESMEQLRDRMSAGKIGIDEVKQAFVDATSEGGQFFNGMEESSKTLSGQLSTLKDNATALIGKITQPFAEAAASTVMPALQNAIDKIATALGLVEDASDNAKGSFFTGPNGEEVTAAKDWLSQIITVWTDGQKEDDTTVAAFIESFSANTDLLIDALKKRLNSAELTPEEKTQIETDIATLQGYNDEIEALLKKRQNGTLTEEDINRLNQITEAKAKLEAQLMETNGLVKTEQEANKAQKIMEWLAQKIDDVTNAIVWMIENWDFVAAVLKTVGAAFLTFKGVLTTAKIIETVTKFSSACTAAGTSIGAVSLAIVGWASVTALFLPGIVYAFNSVVDLFTSWDEVWGPFIESLNLNPFSNLLKYVDMVGVALSNLTAWMTGSSGVKLWADATGRTVEEVEANLKDAEDSSAATAAALESIFTGADFNETYKKKFGDMETATEEKGEEIKKSSKGIIGSIADEINNSNFDKTYNSKINGMEANTKESTTNMKDDTKSNMSSVSSAVTSTASTFRNTSWKFPSFKLPKISVQWIDSGFGGLKIPKISVSWNSSGGGGGTISSSTTKAQPAPSQGTLPNISDYLTPHASGAIFTKPTLLGGTHVVAEAGSEAVLPLNTLWTEMESRMQNAIVNSQIDNSYAQRRAITESTLQQPINITLELDGKTIYQNQQIIKTQLGNDFGMGGFANA